MAATLNLLRIKNLALVEDLQWEHHYDRFAAYGQSKLANLLFTYQLQRRLAEHQKNTIAVAAHPGAANTELGRNAPGLVKTLLALAFNCPPTRSAPGNCAPLIRLYAYCQEPKTRILCVARASRRA